MFTYLTLALAKLGEMLGTDRYQRDLDRFISNKNPSNAAEVDHLIREYDRKVVRQGSFL